MLLLSFSAHPAPRRRVGRKFTIVESEAVAAAAELIEICSSIKFYLTTCIKLSEVTMAKHREWKLKRNESEVN
jgi:hypothetical protein